MKVNAEVCPKGYVIKNCDGRFLSRTMRWVRHKKAQSSAYVHSREALEKGDEWDELAETVAPALYDPTSDVTVVTGEEMPYEQFAQTIRLS